MPERRQFERLAMSEDAIVFDQGGHRLGVVTQVSGSGMQVRLEAAGQQFRLGQQMRIRVLEPATQAQHSIDVVVRSCLTELLGMEFITGSSRQPR